MRQDRDEQDGGRRYRFPSRPRSGTLALIIAVASLVVAAPATAAPPTTPFGQCPAVGFDTSCEVLIVINQQGGLESYVDPSQRNFDGNANYLVGVQNDSSSTVASITLKGKDIFGFDGDGLCSGINESEEAGFLPPPAGCPFGPTSFEGQDTSFSNYKVEDAEENANEGTVNFLGGKLQPGQSAYFSLEGFPQISCAETACEPSALSTELSDGVQSGEAITVADGAAVTDTATLSGANAALAQGVVSYRVYSDNACQNLVDEAGDVSVSGASVPASSAETLPPGTYYWQVSYSGDTHNASLQSPCGSEVETVSPAPTCSKAVGGGHVGAGSGLQNLSNNLNTGLVGKQRFAFAWNHHANSVHLTHLNGASCTISAGERTFTGHGVAAERKAKGYEISFSITFVGGHTYITLTIEKGHAVVEKFNHEQLVLPKKHGELIG
jgi:hypothetical protein